MIILDYVITNGKNEPDIDKLVIWVLENDKVLDSAFRNPNICNLYQFIFEY